MVGPVGVEGGEVVAIHDNNDGRVRGIVGIVFSDGGIGVGDPLVGGLWGESDDDGGLRIVSVAISDCLADVEGSVGHTEQFVCGSSSNGGSL